MFKKLSVIARCLHQGHSIGQDKTSWVLYIVFQGLVDNIYTLLQQYHTRLKQHPEHPAATTKLISIYKLQSLHISFVITAVMSSHENK